MRHIPYPKIPLKSEMSAPGGRWVVTEKVHGAQIVVGTDGDVVRVGKRKAWLDPAEPFFGWQRLKCDLEAVAIETRTRLGARCVRLFGELCGEGVQTGIWYTDDLAVLWFDVVLNDEVFLARHELETLVHPLVPLLARGTRTEIGSVPVRFDTQVPALLGLTPRPPTTAEGWVKKPDARMPFSAPYAIKQKIPEFDEGVGFDDAMPFDPQQRVDVETLSRWARRMMNAARIASARSKVGADARAVVSEAALDVMIDLHSTWPGTLAALDDREEKVLVAMLEACAAEQLR